MCGFAAARGIRLDSPTLEELNYLAYRIGQLSEIERVAMQGVVKRCLDDGAFDGIVPIQDIINMTYGLDELNVLIGVDDDFSLGNFVLDNDLDDDLTGLTENVLDMLDMKQVGRRFREREGGIFIRNCYVSAGEYEFPAVFDGRKLPKDIYCEDSTVFRLKIGQHSAKHAGGTVERAEWIELPISREQADRIAKSTMNAPSAAVCAMGWNLLFHRYRRTNSVQCSSSRNGTVWQP